MGGGALLSLTFANAIDLTKPLTLIYVRNGTDHTAYIDNQSVNITAGDNADFEIVSIGDAWVAGALPFDGMIEDCRIYTIDFAAQRRIDYHNYYANRVVLIDHFRDAAVGQSKAREWKHGTGTYAIAELAAQDAVLKELDVGVKYLECSVAGTIAIPSKQAYGTWEWCIYKGAEGNIPQVFFITDTDGTSALNRYTLVILNDESIELRRASNKLTETVGSYINNQTWYKIKITRTLDGEFYTYIKGGVFGDIYVLISAAGGSGSNPVTDNNRTSGEYIYLDFDAGDRIALLNIQGGVEQ